MSRKTVLILKPGPNCVVSCTQFSEQITLSVPAVYELCKAVSRTVHGLEPEHFSLLYYLFDLSAAGGLEPVISNQKGGGQEAKVKVRILWSQGQF